MKKKWMIFVMVVVLVLPLSAAARYDKTNGIGVGLSLGYPSGITVKYGMDDFRFFGTVGSEFGSEIYLDVGVLYDLAEFAIEDLPFYVNAGASVGFGLGTDFELAINGLIGVSYFLKECPVEFFLNIAPGFRVITEREGFDIGGAVGALWYFE